jgi:hypothetical protein
MLFRGLIAPPPAAEVDVALSRSFLEGTRAVLDLALASTFSSAVTLRATRAVRPPARAGPGASVLAFSSSGDPVAKEGPALWSWLTDRPQLSR